MLGIVAIVELCYRRRIWRRFLCNLSKLFIFTLFLKRGLKIKKKWKLIVLPAIKRPDLQVRAVVLLMDLSRSMKTKQRRQRVNSEQIMPQKTSLQCKQLRSNYCRLLTFSHCHWHLIVLLTVLQKYKRQLQNCKCRLYRNFESRSGPKAYYHMYLVSYV